MTETPNTPNIPPLAWSNMTGLAKARWDEEFGQETIDILLAPPPDDPDLVLQMLEHRLAFDINQPVNPARAKTMLPGLIRAWAIVRDMRGLDWEMESMNKT